MEEDLRYLGCNGGAFEDPLDGGLESDNCGDGRVFTFREPPAAGDGTCIRDGAGPLGGGPGAGAVGVRAGSSAVGVLVTPKPPPG